MSTSRPSATVEPFYPLPTTLLTTHSLTTHCVQVGGKYCLWFRIESAGEVDDEDDTEEGTSTHKGREEEEEEAIVGAGEEAEEGEEEEEDDDDDDEMDREEEPEEPEEQEGAWIVTDSALVGSRRIDAKLVAAQVGEAAMQPSAVVHGVWSVAGEHAG